MRVCGEAVNGEVAFCKVQHGHDAGPPQRSGPTFKTHILDAG